MMHRRGQRRRKQQEGETKHQDVAKPLHIAKQVVDALSDRQALAVARLQQAAPVQPQDLDSTQRPTKALLLESVEAQRHQALPVGTWHVDAGVAARQHAQAGLGVLRHDIGIPASDFLQRAAPDEAHRAREDDRVPVRATGHRDLEEVLVAEVEPPQVLVVRPVAIVLRGLNERDLGIGEVADHRAEPVRLDHVIGVDDADDLDVCRQARGCFVQRAGFESGPVLEVHELESWTQLLALSFERSPDLTIRGVVVDDLHDQGRIVELRERPERFAHDLERFVVRGNLNRHLGEVVRIERVGWFRCPAQRVHDLKEIGQRQPQGGQLQQQQQRGRDQVNGIAGHGVGDGRGVEQIGDRGQRGSRKQLRTQPAPGAEAHPQNGGCEQCGRGEPNLEIALLANDGRAPGHQRDQCQAEGQAGPDPCAHDPGRERPDRRGSAQGAKEQRRVEEHEERTRLNSF